MSYMCVNSCVHVIVMAHLMTMHQCHVIFWLLCTLQTWLCEYHQTAGQHPTVLSNNIDDTSLHVHAYMCTHMHHYITTCMTHTHAHTSHDYACHTPCTMTMSLLCSLCSLCSSLSGSLDSLKFQLRGAMPPLEPPDYGIQTAGAI